MAEEQKTLRLGDQDVPVTQLDVVSRSAEPPADFVLEDGSVIRVTNAVVIVYRMNEVFDGDGDPIYLVRMGTSVTTLKSDPKQNKSARKGNGKAN